LSGRFETNRSYCHCSDFYVVKFAQSQNNHRPWPFRTRTHPTIRKILIISLTHELRNSVSSLTCNKLNLLDLTRHVPSTAFTPSRLAKHLNTLIDSEIRGKGGWRLPTHTTRFHPFKQFQLSSKRLSSLHESQVPPTNKFYLRLARKGSGFRTVRNMSDRIGGKAHTPPRIEVIVLVSPLGIIISLDRDCLEFAIKDRESSLWWGDWTRGGHDCGRPNWCFGAATSIGYVHAWHLFAFSWLVTS
jgi:hypothetical protein